MGIRPKPWNVLGSTRLVTSPWYNVAKERVELPDGTVIDDFYTVHGIPTICVLALRQDGKAAFVRQYRHGIRRATLELPGGCVDPGETPLEAAKRELAEETGLVSKKWDKFTRAHLDPARSDAYVDFYLAREVEFDESLLPAEMEVEFFGTQDALARADELGIDWMGTLLALQMAG